MLAYGRMGWAETPGGRPMAAVLHEVSDVLALAARGSFDVFDPVTTASGRHEAYRHTKSVFVQL